MDAGDTDSTGDIVFDFTANLSGFSICHRETQDCGRHRLKFPVFLAG